MILPQPGDTVRVSYEDVWDPSKADPFNDFRLGVSEDGMYDVWEVPNPKRVVKVEVIERARTLPETPGSVVRVGDTIWLKNSDGSWRAHNSYTYITDAFLEQMPWEPVHDEGNRVTLDPKREEVSV